MARVVIRLIVVMSVVQAAGCGTLCNLPEKTGFGILDMTPTERIYGGVLRDLEMGMDGLNEAARPDCKGGRLDNLFGGTYWLMVDLPLSAVGDTLTLPWTISATLNRFRLSELHSATDVKASEGANPDSPPVVGANPR